MVRAYTGFLTDFRSITRDLRNYAHKKAASAKMAICCLTKIYPRPHVESNHDLAFRKRPFYPLNYRGGIK